MFLAVEAPSGRNATRWLYISRATLEEQDNETLLDLVGAHRVVEHFKRGTTKLLLTPTGLYEVGPDLGQKQA